MIYGKVTFFYIVDSLFESLVQTGKISIAVGILFLDAKAHTWNINRSQSHA